MLAWLVQFCYIIRICAHFSNCWVLKCLFGVFCLTREFFNSYGNVTITGEGPQILIYAKQSWSVSSDGSLACHTYADMGHLFIMVISKDCDTHTYCRAFCNRAVTTCIKDLGLSGLGFEHSNFACRMNALTHCATAAAVFVIT